MKTKIETEMKTKSNKQNTNQSLINNGVYMKRKMVFLVLALCAMVLFSATSTFAAGTRAGTVITNTATLNYADMSGGAFTGVTATDTISVEQVASVSISQTEDFHWASDSMYIYFPMTITNTGNYDDIFTLSSSDNKTWEQKIYFDVNGNGIISGSPTEVGVTPKMADEATYKIILRVFVPKNVTSNQIDSIKTTATSSFNNNIEPVATATATDSIRTRTADVTVNKTRDKAAPKPGDVITYTITYNNTGTGTGVNASLTDILDANVTFVSAVVNSGGGTAALQTSPNRVVWSTIGSDPEYPGHVKDGMTGQLTVKVSVNANVSEGTSISNSATLSYNDSISSRLEYPVGGPVTSTVAQAAAWQIQIEKAGLNAFAVDSAYDSIDVSKTMYFKIKLTNTGNKTDQATIARTNTSGSFTWSLYKDIDNSGTYTTGDVLFDPTTENTGDILKGESIEFIASAPIAHSVADSSRDSAYYHITSVTKPDDATDSGWTISRVQAPKMSLAKSVVPFRNGRSRPGDTLVYTITYTNLGSGASTLVLISDSQPANTTLLTNGYATGYAVQLDGVNKTNDSDSDEVTITGTSISVNIGGLDSRLKSGGHYTGTVKFMVRIN
jgi:uncharacterized repeat protein (TIGR01451 family)